MMYFHTLHSFFLVILRINICFTRVQQTGFEFTYLHHSSHNGRFRYQIVPVLLSNPSSIVLFSRLVFIFRQIGVLPVYRFLLPSNLSISHSIYMYSLKLIKIPYIIYINCINIEIFRKHEILHRGA